MGNVQIYQKRISILQSGVALDYIGCEFLSILVSREQEHERDQDLFIGNRIRLTGTIYLSLVSSDPFVLGRVFTLCCSSDGIKK
jgi:hypothetical protein